MSFDTHPQDADLAWWPTDAEWWPIAFQRWRLARGDFEDDLCGSATLAPPPSGSVLRALRGIGLVGR